MATVRIWPAEPVAQRELSREAGNLLRKGGLVVFPTDTVYGVGAVPSNPDAIRRIYEVKGRADEKAIVWLVESIESVKSVCQVPAPAIRLAERFWPGPLTLILTRARSEPNSPPTLGVRVPAHPAALAIIQAAGGAVATTSANKSGEPSARNATEAAAHLGPMVDLIIDGGPSPLGVESTVLDLASDPPRVLRAGALSTDQLAVELGVDAPTLSRS